MLNTKTPYYLSPNKPELALNSSGHVIGTIAVAEYLVSYKRIEPEKISPGDNVCSIGFCAPENKYYGWFKGTMFAFGIGHKMRRGDVGYVPVDISDWMGIQVDFWSWPNKQDVDYALIVNVDKEIVLRISWPIPGHHRQRASVELPPPSTYGRGEYQAVSLNEARDMAIDFVRAVS